MIVLFRFETSRNILFFSKSYIFYRTGLGYIKRHFRLELNRQRHRLVKLQNFRKITLQQQKNSISISTQEN